MDKKLSNVEKLERFVKSLGWYSGTSNLTISLTGAFEGFSNRATETWEYQTIITLKEVLNDSGKIICPYMKFTSRGIESMEKVAGRMFTELIDWKAEYEYENLSKEEVIKFIESKGWVQCYNDDNWVHEDNVKNNPHFEGLRRKWVLVK